MSLQTDYMESGLGAEEYIRTIWAETELTEDMLVDVDLGYFRTEIFARQSFQAGSKREMLANMFTRVLRGELVATVQHRLPEEANTVLSQRGVNPWQARLDKLIALELGLRR